MIALAELLPLARDLEVAARSSLSKAALPAGIAVRDSRVADLEQQMTEYFVAAGDRAVATVAKAIGWDPDKAIDWAAEQTAIEEILEAWYIAIGIDAFDSVAEQLGVELSFDLANENVHDVIDQVALEVTRITDQTRDVLRGIVERATLRGSSVDTVAGEIASTFTTWSTGRAKTIALTETANAYNQASLAGYANTGLVDEVEVFDGPDCGWTHHDDPDLANRSVRTLEEAKRFPISHPNCQRAFGAVVVR